jgi:hypothetical protein
MKTQEKIQLIYDWVTEHDQVNFDLEFVESVDRQLEYRKASPLQEEALDNIIETYKMN